jgi:putative ABC transport system permease protein
VTSTIPSIRTRLGVTYVSPEVHMQTTVRRDGSGADGAQVMTRGILPEAFLVHAGVRLADGRMPRPGYDEILVGMRCDERIGVPPEELAAGRTLRFFDRTWTIVGHIESPGRIVESEVWVPLHDLMVAARRDTLSCVVLTLDEGEFDDVDAFARQRLDLELVAMRERDYFARLSAFFAPVRVLVWVTAILIASGGIVGGLDTMYAAFASRVREIGALQARGFRRRSVTKSLVQESVLAALAGTVVATVLGLLVLDGLSVRFSTGVFGLTVDAPVLLIGLAAGGLVGLVGALPPAWRCLRLPINEALKA